MSIPYQDPHGWELIEDIRAERAGAFDEFHRRYLPHVRAIVASRCSDPNAVDDIVQEVFIRAWRHIGNVRAERGSPFAWLATIAGNLVHDYRRNPWTRRVIVADHTAIERDPAGAVAALSELQYLEDDHVEDRWAADLVRPLLEQLNDNYREVLIGLLEGASIADEAARLGITGPAVRAARHRARRSLVQHLGACGVQSINDALSYSTEGRLGELEETSA